MWWTIKVLDPNNIEWQHRVVFEGGQFWGVENLHRLFPNNTDWTLFLGQIMALEQGSINNVVNREGETNHISWVRDSK